MRSAWELERADDDHLLVLAACWGVEERSVLDRSAVWVQQVHAGDAPGPRVVQLDDRWVTVLEAPGRTAARWSDRMVGLRGLLRVPVGITAPAPSLLGPADQAAALRLHCRVAVTDRAAASPTPEGSLLAVGHREGGELVGIASVVETPSGPPEVSILVDPRMRGNGLATTLERSLVRAAAGRWEWLQHRTVDTDAASRALARRVGFRLVSIEHLLAPR